MSIGIRRAAARRRAAGIVIGTFLGKNHSQKTKDFLSKLTKERLKRDGHPRGMKGKKHTNSTKDKIKITGVINSAMKGRKGKDHPTGDTIWWNDGVTHKRSILKPGPEWVTGRIFKERTKRKTHGSAEKEN